MRKKLIGGLAAVTLLVAVPAWAHDGHGQREHDRYWHQHHFHGHYVRERYVVREIVRPVTVYPQANNSAAAAGIHVIFPNVFIPFN